MVYLVCFACIISTVRTKNKPFHHFSNIALTFAGNFRFFIHRPDWLSFFKKIHTIIRKERLFELGQ